MYKVRHKIIGRTMAALLAAVLLLSGCGDPSRTSGALEQTDPAGESFSVAEWHLIGYAPYKHHDYVYGYYEEEELVGSCTAVMCVYTGEAVCDDGESIGLTSKPVYVHLHCGRSINISPYKTSITRVTHAAKWYDEKVNIGEKRQK